MGRKFVWIPLLIAGAMVGRRLMPAEWRESLSRLPGTLMTRMLEHMPEQ